MIIDHALRQDQKSYSRLTVVRCFLSSNKIQYTYSKFTFVNFVI